VRGTRARALAVVGLVALGAAAACVDLFHSTDFETICGVRPETKGCDAGEAGHAEASGDAKHPVDAGPIDFCALEAGTARNMAEHACAWLGACTAPFDQNAFGQCMINAILAFDCNTNPNFPIAEGPLHDLWQTLAGATSCTEVTSAIFPNAVGCLGTGNACAGSSDPNVVLECVDGVVVGPETCLVEGRVCVGSGVCAPTGAEGGACEGGFSCSGNVLHDCEGSGDLGRDCRDFGAGSCTPEGGVDGGAACVPTFGSDAGPSCDPTNAVTCVGDAGADAGEAGDGSVGIGIKATSCPTGNVVSVDCQALTGGVCVPGTPSPVWNVAAQCQGTSGCTPGCDGGAVVGCAQGGMFSTSCASQGLGDCQTVSLTGDAGYACSPPGTK
jgi:hypothetical protein